MIDVIAIAVVLEPWYKTTYQEISPSGNGLILKDVTSFTLELAIRHNRYGFTAEAVTNMLDFEVHASGTRPGTNVSTPATFVGETGKYGNHRIGKNGFDFSWTTPLEVGDIPVDLDASGMATPLYVLKRIDKQARKKVDADRHHLFRHRQKKLNKSKDIRIPSAKDQNDDAEPNDDPLTRVRTTTLHSPKGNNKSSNPQKRLRKTKSSEDLSRRYEERRSENSRTSCKPVLGHHEIIPAKPSVPVIFKAS